MEIKVTKLTHENLLPPAKHLCQVCATEHEPDQPHNPQSFYYQFAFNAEHGRGVTWRDAMAHCSQEVKDLWCIYLQELGVDLDDPSNLVGKARSRSASLRLIATRCTERPCQSKIS